MKLLKLKTLIFSLCLIFCLKTLALENKLRILCSTFPIYQITRNVVGNQKNIDVSLMLPAQLGCPHDYALTPHDMQKLAKADVLVINGLGLEEFMGAPIKKANPKLKIIDSSTGIKNTIKFEDNHHHKHGEHCNHAIKVNPHLFVSPAMQEKLALNIAERLAQIDKNNAQFFHKNAETYAKKMQQLAKELKSLGPTLKNNRIIQPHGVFDYLARDAGLKIIATIQSHGHQPSAAEMIEIVNKIKKQKAGAIFTEPQYPEKIGKTLSKETKIPVAMLDPAATGPSNAPLDYYQLIMQKNIKVLKKNLRK